jgi:uncharacterized coiled-coil protein SlyX
MQKITNLSDLKASIKELEMKTSQQEQLLKNESKSTVSHYKPMNLLRMGLQKVIKTPDVRYTLVNTFIGLAAGYIAQKVIMGKSRNIFRRTIAAAVQTALVRIAYKNLPFFQHSRSSSTAVVPPRKRIAASSATGQL